MKRVSLCWIVAAAALAAAAPAAAQDPAEVARQLSSDRFTLVSPFPPGGPTDTLARVLADGLGQRYKTAAVVESATGASGNIGMEKVKRAKGDGHTLLIIPAGNLTINPTLMPNFPFDVQKDFVPITMLAAAPNVIVAGKDSGIKSIADLIARAKSRPGTVSYASPGIGSSLHLSGELFKEQTGVDMLHVAYKGTPPALNDVMAGVLPLTFTNLPAALPFIQDGRLVALATTQAQRTPAAPQVPTLAEEGVKGINVASWYGMLAPAGTPPAVASQLARDAAEILAQPDVRQRLTAQGMAQATMTPAAFDKAIRDETTVWAGVIRSRHIQAQ